MNVKKVSLTIFKRITITAYQMRFTFFTENSLRKLFCKPKDQLAPEDNTTVMKLTVVTVKQKSV